jgi:hypothetical protein
MGFTVEWTRKRLFFFNSCVVSRPTLRKVVKIMNGDQSMNEEDTSVESPVELLIMAEVCYFKQI